LNSSNYAGTVTFVTSVSSTDGTPANLTITASPVTLASGGTGTSTLTIAANMSAGNQTPALPWNGGATTVFCALLLGVPFTFRRKRLAAALSLTLILCVAGFLTACGGGTANQQPQTKAARTYVVTATPTGTVTTAGSTTVTNPAAVTITVTVQ
jgi:hypothetical protein